MATYTVQIIDCEQATLPLHHSICHLTSSLHWPPSLFFLFAFTHRCFRSLVLANCLTSSLAIWLDTDEANVHTFQECTISRVNSWHSFHSYSLLHRVASSIFSPHLTCLSRSFTSPSNRGHCIRYLISLDLSFNLDSSSFQQISDKCLLNEREESRMKQKPRQQ